MSKYIKIIIKYFFTVVLGFNLFSIASKLASNKSDFENLIGLLIFLGLFIGLVVVLSSDVKLLVQKLNNKTK